MAGSKFRAQGTGTAVDGWVRRARCPVSAGLSYPRVRSPEPAWTGPREKHGPSMYLPDRQNQEHMELVKNADSWAPPTSTELETLGMGPGNLLNNPSRRL